MNYYIMVLMPDGHYLLASSWDRKEDAIIAQKEVKLMFSTVSVKDILIVQVVYA